MPTISSKVSAPSDPLGIRCLAGVGLNGSQFHCDVCGQDVTKQPVRVRCAQCRDFDLCLRCFSKREEKDDHLWTHDYIILGGRGLPLLDVEWSAVEEFILVEGVSRVGLGNWNDIAESVAFGSSSMQPSKKLADCEQHYQSFYLSRPLCLPQMADIYFPQGNVIPKYTGLSTVAFKRKTGRLVGKGTQYGPIGWTRLAAANLRDSLPGVGEVNNLDGLGKDSKVDQAFLELTGSVNPRGDDVSQDTLAKGGMKPETGNPTSGPVKEELHDSPVPPPSLPVRLASSTRNSADPEPIPGSHILGSLPLRNELELEYDPEAEYMIADLEFTGKESPLELDLKLMTLSIYNARLDERCRRKRILLEKSSLDLRKHKIFQQTKSQEDREIALLTYPLAQCLSEDEHMEMIKLIMEERLVNVRLAYLREWLMNGLCSLDDVQKFENEVYHLQGIHALGHERHYSNGTTMDEFTPEEQKLIKYWESRTDVKCADKFTGQGSGSGADGPKGLQRTSLQGNTVFTSYHPSVIDYPPKDEQVPLDEDIPISKAGASSAGQERSSFSNMEGAQYLNEVELAFCEKLEISPLQFLLMRVIVSKEAAKWENVDEEIPGLLRKLDIRDSVLSHFIDSMLIMPRPVPGSELRKEAGAGFAHRKSRPGADKKKKSKMIPPEVKPSFSMTASPVQ